MAKIKITAVGDISFAGHYSDQPDISVFSKLIPIFKDSDLVIANLESPLIDNGHSIPNKCTLRGSRKWAQVLNRANFHVFSLANNHLMDYGSDGLFSTIKSLKKQKLIFIGAGRNKEEADAPKYFNIGEVKIALLARTSVIVSSPSYAEENRPGVAFFNKAETIEQIKRCRRECNYIILILHWGIENYHYPSPQQRLLATELLENGLDILIGHHPHVLQGIERIGHGVVCYSLGNFAFDDFEWTFVDNENRKRSKWLRLSKEQREGMIFQCVLRKSGLLNFKTIYTHIEKNARIEIDRNPRRVKRFTKLSSKMQNPLYAKWWQFYAFRNEWQLRVWRRLSIKKILTKIWKIRPRHIKDFVSSLSRSSKIVSGKSTNPYE